MTENKEPIIKTIAGNWNKSLILPKDSQVKIGEIGH